MSAQIYILPIVPLFPAERADWREQYERQCEAVSDALREPPPRTRPILISQHKQLSDGHRPEGER